MGLGGNGSVRDAFQVRKTGLRKDSVESTTVSVVQVRYDCLKKETMCGNFWSTNHFRESDACGVEMEGQLERLQRSS